MRAFKSEPPAHISEFAKEFNFDNLRPYYDSEVEPIMQRMAKDPLYMQLMSYLWKGISEDEAIQKAKSVKSIANFQHYYMYEAIWKIVDFSSTGLSWSGLEHLDKNSSYLFIANHRDILLDSALLQIILVKEGFDTSEITFGSNLMEKGFITDFGRMNRMFTVTREGTAKELYDISRQLSAYIRHTIVDKKTSVWIAQRNGRTKDGNDLTQTGLLKMLNMSGGKDFVKSFKELQIVPLSISYEYEPCDALKVQELYLSNLHSKYIKAPGEDLNSIVTGITQPKGKIHLTFGKPILNELENIDKRCQTDNEKIKALTESIDQQIYLDFKLHHVNYIAYDLLHKTDVFTDTYTAQEKEVFKNYMKKQLSNLSGEQEVLEQLFLHLYSNPVVHKLKL